jgi:hypothetical protein
MYLMMEERGRERDLEIVPSYTTCNALQQHQQPLQSINTLEKHKKTKPSNNIKHHQVMKKTIPYVCLCTTNILAIYE